ncbi:hypothetical protein BAE39_29515 [Mesorhizobium loti]|uniref:Peptidase C39 domain-containing protein n=1 Tax=Rhizobium loti TaxID=381 RepID=A0A1A5QQV9_RHILI|nr:hypothetical protein BAE39_29515 [Mesorhizobium loti]OBQ69657.1 hypothetical protein A8145_29195 [Mesorhizobium loti]
MEAARKLGFVAKGVKGGFDSLYKIPKPAIAHVVVSEVLHHFVVVQEINARWVIVMDPAYGEIRKLAHEEFKKQWTGALVLLVPADTFKRRDETAHRAGASCWSTSSGVACRLEELACVVGEQHRTVRHLAELQWPYVHRRVTAATSASRVDKVSAYIFSR